MEGYLRNILNTGRRGSVCPAPGASARPHRRRRRGLGLVELMLCLGISSMLLTATGVTFYASFNSYRDNMARGALINMGRVFMDRVTADLRMSDAQGPYDLDGGIFGTENNEFATGQVPGAVTAGLPSAGGTGAHGIQMIKTHSDSQDPSASVSNPVTISYWFDTTKDQLLTSRQNGAGAVSTIILATGVQSFQAYLQPVYMPYNPTTGAAAGWALQRAVINLTLANKDANGNAVVSGGQNVTVFLTDAAMPRRNFQTH